MAICRIENVAHDVAVTRRAEQLQPRQTGALEPSGCRGSRLGAALACEAPNPRAAMFEGRSRVAKLGDGKRASVLPVQPFVVQPGCNSA
jgi:hypothetical protein